MCYHYLRYTIRPCHLKMPSLAAEYSKDHPRLQRLNWPIIIAFGRIEHDNQISSEAFSTANLPLTSIPLPSLCLHAHPAQFQTMQPSCQTQPPSALEYLCRVDDPPSGQDHHLTIIGQFHQHLTSVDVPTAEGTTISLLDHERRTASSRGAEEA